MKKSKFCILLSVFFFFSCNEDDILSLNEIDNILDTFEEYVSSNNHSSDYIYDENKLHRFDLYLNDENLEKINSDPAAENYVEGSLVFENKVIKNVGVRYKGSIGAWVGCLSNDDWTNPSGYKTCPKLSMKIKINWRDDKTFYGLKKLQFHSQNLDPSKMHERLGYWMFRKFGVPTARSTHAILYINEEFNGIFANTENIDGPFTDKHFENGDGNLYKEVWPINSNGTVNSENYFIDGLKTNEETADVSKIIKFGTEVQNASGENIHQIVDNWMDIDQFLKNIVVDRRIANDDGFLHWYQNDGNYYSSHNYYWYESELNEEIQLIPWDLDNAFENLITDVNPVTPIKDKWYETTANCNGFRHGLFLIKQKSAACDKIIGSFITYKNRYDSLDNVFKEQYFNMSNINNLLSQWSNQIEDAMKEANQKFGNAEINVTNWKGEIEKLKTQIELSLN